MNSHLHIPIRLKWDCSKFSRKSMVLKRIVFLQKDALQPDMTDGPPEWIPSCRQQDPL